MVREQYKGYNKIQQHITILCLSRKLNTTIVTCASTENYDNAAVNCRAIPCKNEALNPQQFNEVSIKKLQTTKRHLSPGNKIKDKNEHFNTSLNDLPILYKDTFKIVSPSKIVTSVKHISETSTNSKCVAQKKRS